MMGKTLIAFVVGVLGACIVLYIGIKTNYPIGELKAKVVIKYKDKVIRKNPEGTVLNITLEDLKIDLLRYKALSQRQRKLILGNIEVVAKDYNISVLALYAILATESSFNPVSKGKLIKVKGKSTRGMGLGNVVYEWHPDLVEKGLLEKKGDLFNIAINIRVAGYIYAKYKKKPLKVGTESKDESAQRRYYGGNLKSYSEKIKKKISEIMFKKVYK